MTAVSSAAAAAEDATAVLSKHVLSIGAAGGLALLLDAGKVHEMGGPVHLVVELLGVGKGQLVAHVGVVAHAHEVVIPGALNQGIFMYVCI